MAFQAEVNNNYRLLKAKVGQMDLKELLEPHFPQLLDQTINPIKLAYHLFQQGVISIDEKEECREASTTFCQNLEVYQIVKKKNAGEALIDALYESGNAHVLHLLLSKKGESSNSNPEPDEIPNLNLNSLNIPVAKLMFKSIVHDAAAHDPETPEDRNNLSPVSPNTSNQISILKTISQMKSSPNNAWIHTVGGVSLSRIEESTLDWTLARVVTTCDSGNPRKYFNPSDFHQQEESAVLEFLKCQLKLDLVEQTMGRPPTEIYINTRSFSYKQWEWLSRLLCYFCRDSLENLWLENVDYKEYCSGLKWLTNSNKDEPQPHLRFPKLKYCILQVNPLIINAESFHNILVLIKSIDYPIQDLWNGTNPCQVQLWTENYNWCPVLLDPANGTLYISDEIGEQLKEEMDKIFGGKLPTTESVSEIGQPVPVVKLYYTDPRLTVITEEINSNLLTNLFIRFTQSNNIITIEDEDERDAIQEVVKYLPRFKSLQKLLLSADRQWFIDLNQLDILDDLSFIYFRNANCLGMAVDNFPWRKSVQTLILNGCTECRLATPGLESVPPNFSNCIMLERNLQQKLLVPFQPFHVSVMSNQDVCIKVLREFYN